MVTGNEEERRKRESERVRKKEGIERDPLETELLVKVLADAISVDATCHNTLSKTSKNVL